MARREREGLDPYERAVLAGPQAKAGGDADDEDQGPPPLPRRATLGNLRVGAMGILLFLALLVLVSVVRGSSSPQALLEPSCDASELALATVEVEQFQPLPYAYAGPDGRYLVTVDAAEVGATTTPLAGREVQQVRAWGDVRGCRLTGSFGVQVDPGRHVLQVWRAPRECDADRPGCPLAELVAYAAFVVLPER